MFFFHAVAKSAGLETADRGKFIEPVPAPIGGPPRAINRSSAIQDARFQPKQGDLTSRKMRRKSVQIRGCFIR
jgi:hypothetical protein